MNKPYLKINQILQAGNIIRTELKIVIAKYNIYFCPGTYIIHKYRTQ